MSTMQSTLQKIAAEEANADSGQGWEPAGPVLPLEPAPEPSPAPPEAAAQHSNLPAIGTMVVYHLRDGDSRNMRSKFPAIVLDANAASGRLSLIIIIDAGDEWRQDHVAPRAAPEPGWEWPMAPAVAAIPTDGMAPLTPDATEAVTDLLQGILVRVSALEAKRGPGRPKTTGL